MKRFKTLLLDVPNLPTRVTKDAISAIDHITNSIIKKRI